MPLNTRDLAAETLLLLVSATLLCMGATSLLVGLVLPQVVFGPMLVPDAALATLLIGVSLLATLCQWRVVRLASAGGLTALLLYTLLHNLMAQGVSESWVTGQPRMTSLAAAVLLVVNVCLWRGVEGVARQRWWRATGIGLLLFGGVVVLQLWRPQANQATLFTFSPLAVLVFIVLLAVTLLVAGWRQRHERLSPGRLTVMVGLAGVLASSIAWLLLSMHQRSSTEQQAGYLLDSVQLNAEQVMTERLQLMQRMAERLAMVEGQPRDVLLTRDAQNYFRDTLSLHAIALMDASGVLSWSQGRRHTSDIWLLEQLSTPSVQAWADIPFDRPRLLIPDSLQPNNVIMLIPIPDSAQRLLASFNLGELLSNELRLALGPFHVDVSRLQHRLVRLHPSGFTVDDGEASTLMLASRHMGLPGGSTSC